MYIFLFRIKDTIKIFMHIVKSKMKSLRLISIIEMTLSPLRERERDLFQLTEDAISKFQNFNIILLCVPLNCIAN